jgi:predicted AAA+ superfamily ATPase
LLNYFEDILYKDLINRYGIRKIQDLKSLAKYYVSNPSTLTTFNALKKFLKLSLATLDKFSFYLESAYLIYFLKRYSQKVKLQEKSPRKIYALDTGLANTLGFKFIEDRGHMAENLVFLELNRRKIYNKQWELYYWKDDSHREVDFLIKEGASIKQAIQVCWSFSHFKTREREIKSLLLCLEELKLKEGFILTEAQEEKLTLKGFTIYIKPIHQWLLEE